MVIILLLSIVRVWVLNILISVRSLRSQDQVSYLEGIPACGALIVLALSLLALQCIWLVVDEPLNDHRRRFG